MRKLDKISENTIIKNKLADLYDVMKIKRTISFIIVLLLDCFYFYYLSIFCYLYKYTQLILALSIFVSFVMNVLYTLIISFIITLFRFIGIKTKSWIMFKISDLIHILL